MRRAAHFAVALSLALGGCGKAKVVNQPSVPPQAPVVDTKPKDPDEAERDGILEGAFQLGNAAQDLQKVIDSAKALQASTKNPDLKAALGDLLDSLDDAGASIADFTGEPPELEEFKQKFAVYDQKRLDAVDGSNDAIHDINDAWDAIGDFEDNPDPADAQGLDDIDNALSDANDDLTDAIKAFGGKVESDDTQDVTPGGSGNDKGSNAATKPDL